MTQPKMNPEIKAQWVAALRSGEYKQGKRALNRDGKFCCLGVLCDLHSKAHGIPWGGRPMYNFRYEGAVVFPNSNVYAWAGMNAEAGTSVSIDGDGNYLYSHNDNGRTFEEIAKAIEEQL